MKKLANIIFSVVLILSLLIPTILYVPITVYASEDNNALYPYFDNNSQPTRKLTELLQLLTMQAGAFVTGDIENYRDCSEEIDKLFNYEYAKGQFVKNSDGGLTVKSDYINTLISGIKNGAQQKYGYSYFQTLPYSSMLAVMFKDSEYYHNARELAKLCDYGYLYSPYKNMVVQLPTLSQIVLVSKSDRFGDTIITDSAIMLNTSLSGVRCSSAICINYTNFTDANTFYTTNEWNYCYGKDYFKYICDNDVTQLKSTSALFFFTPNGVKIPMFQSSEHYTNYLLEHGGYYVGSNFKDTIDNDFVITPDMLNNIDKYLKDYDGLLKQIQDLLNNELDFEKVQQLIDNYLKKMSESLDDIEQGQEQSNTWLEKIYNAIIDLPNKITHSDNNSNDIDLTELNKSLTTVINRLDTINSKLNNIDTDDDNEKLTDIETAITDNKSVLNSIKTELTSQSVDIKEISTQLQGVADSLKDLSSDVDTINTELSDMSDQLGNISNSLNDLAVTLENIEKELKDTNGLLADIKDTLKAIKNWLVADTIFDGIDLISDLADFIKDFSKRFKTRRLSKSPFIC